MSRLSLCYVPSLLSMPRALPLNSFWLGSLNKMIPPLLLIQPMSLLTVQQNPQLPLSLRPLRQNNLGCLRFVS